MSGAPVPARGQLVTVRRRRYAVVDVKEGAVPADAFARAADARPQHLVQLQSVEDDALGEELSVVWEIEPGTQVYERATLPDPGVGFDDPARLDAFLDAVRWGAVASADHKNLHAPFRSGITIEDYQLDPVVRAIQMPRVNLLVADDVGLGKTIESGLVVQELILRHRARTVLVVCPAGLQLQWRDQMRDKFGLEFRIVDAELMRDLRRRRGLHVNPWTHFPRLITSVDFLKRERPLRLLREVLPPEGQPAFPRKFDLLIVDEAHNVAPSGRGHYAVDSLRTQAIRALAPHFEHKLFLTATPHNGYTESFASLLELLDDQRFHRGLRPDPKQVQAVMVRRLKRELPPDDLGRPRFPERVLDALEVDWSEAEREAHTLLTCYAKLREEGAGDATERFATEFVLKLLKKRLFSSPAAFRLTLEQHLRTLRGGKQKARTLRKPTVGLLRREIERAEEESADDQAFEELQGEVVDTTTSVLRPPGEEEQRLLDALLSWAQAAEQRGDAKWRRLKAWLDETLKTDGKWNDTRVIVFTEYRATQNWLAERLAAAGFTGSGRMEQLYGGLPTEDRERIKAAFQAAPEVSPVRLLLATDAASEGIDLQNHCARLVHYEIPWNPNRMEQRNGRIDRHGQRASEVRIFHFVGRGFDRAGGAAERPPGELEGDLEFLMRAALKVDQIREDLGNVGDVIAAQVEEAMLGRRRRLEADPRSDRAAEARSMLRFERKLREQLEQLHARLTDTQRELRLSPENLRAVVDVGLALAGLPPLEPVEVPGRRPGTTGTAFRVPPLTGSWRAGADGLHHPHTGERRPVVFDHALAESRDDVVLAHLNHRLVQMCLRLLRAEVWAPEGQGKLARVSARVADVDHPVVLAHARLLVLGADAERLHEELVVAGGVLRKGRFARLKVGEVQAAVESARAPGIADAPAEVKARLAELWPSHDEALLSALEARKAERTKGLAGALQDRADQEITDVTRVLEELRRTLEAELGREPPTQLTLFSGEERDQFERNKEALLARVRMIPEEIERETAAIRARYAAPEARLFPVAITYLVPPGVM